MFPTFKLQPEIWCKLLNTIETLQGGLYTHSKQIATQ